MFVVSTQQCINTTHQWDTRLKAASAVSKCTFSHVLQDQLVFKICHWLHCSSQYCLKFPSFQMAFFSRCVFPPFLRQAGFGLCPCQLCKHSWIGEDSSMFPLLFGFPEKSKIMIGECCPNLGFIGANLPLCNHYRQSCVLPLILAVCNSLIIPYQWRTSHGDQGGTEELQRSTCLFIFQRPSKGGKGSPWAAFPLVTPGGWGHLPFWWTPRHKGVNASSSL